MHFQTRKLAQRSALLLAFSFSLVVAGCADVSDADESGLSEASQDLSGAPEIPASLAVPAGNHLAFWLKARGVQIYACKEPTAGSYAWTFVEPEADLFGPFGKLVVGHHYVGPTWELKDGSTVVGAKVAGATVDATAIPWLLLKAVSNTGKGLLSKVTYIQRLYTEAGLAPTSGCDAAHLGASADVPYTATYAFYW